VLDITASGGRRQGGAAVYGKNFLPRPHAGHGRRAGVRNTLHPCGGGPAVLKAAKLRSRGAPTLNTYARA